MRQLTINKGSTDCGSSSLTLTGNRVLETSKELNIHSGSLWLVRWMRCPCCTSLNLILYFINWWYTNNYLYDWLNRCILTQGSSPNIAHYQWNSFHPYWIVHFDCKVWVLLTQIQQFILDSDWTSMETKRNSMKQKSSSLPFISCQLLVQPPLYSASSPLSSGASSACSGSGSGSDSFSASIRSFV